MCHKSGNNEAASTLLIDCDGFADLAKGASNINGVEFYRVGSSQDAPRIEAAIERANLVFVTARLASSTGMSKATETGLLAKRAQFLTVGIVIAPPQIEHGRLSEELRLHCKKLSQAVDSLVLIPEDRLQQLGHHDLCLRDTSANHADLLVYAVRCISDMMTIPGLMCLDFNDVRRVLQTKGMARMGIGLSTGEGRALEAAREAISSPLLGGVCLRTATKVLINISGGSDLGIHELDEACTLVEESVSEDADIVIGAPVDEKFGGEFRLTLIASGFE